jgi:uncharacterized membrane protein
MKNLKKQFLTFATIFTIMVILDFIWLGIIQKSYFAGMLKKLNCGGSVKTNWPSIVIIYFVMAFSLYYFVFYTAEDEISLATVVMRSVLIAMAIYVVFDFTLMNMASAWGWNDAIKDIAWGNILFVTVAVITYYMVHY